MGVPKLFGLGPRLPGTAAAVVKRHLTLDLHIYIYIYDDITMLKKCMRQDAGGHSRHVWHGFEKRGGQSIRKMFVTPSSSLNPVASYLPCLSVISRESDIPNIARDAFSRMINRTPLVFPSLQVLLAALAPTDSDEDIPTNSPTGTRGKTAQPTTTSRRGRGPGGRGGKARGRSGGAGGSGKEGLGQGISSATKKSAYATVMDLQQQPELGETRQVATAGSEHTMGTVGKGNANFQSAADASNRSGRSQDDTGSGSGGGNSCEAMSTSDSAGMPGVDGKMEVSSAFVGGVTVSRGSGGSSTGRRQKRARERLCPQQQRQKKQRQKQKNVQRHRKQSKARDDSMLCTEESDAHGGDSERGNDGNDDVGDGYDDADDNADGDSESDQGKVPSGDLDGSDDESQNANGIDMNNNTNSNIDDDSSNLNNGYKGSKNIPSKDSSNESRVSNSSSDSEASDSEDGPGGNSDGSEDPDGINSTYARREKRGGVDVSDNGDRNMEEKPGEHSGGRSGDDEHRTQKRKIGGKS